MKLKLDPRLLEERKRLQDLTQDLNYHQTLHKHSFKGRHTDRTRKVSYRTDKTGGR